MLEMVFVMVMVAMASDEVADCSYRDLRGSSSKKRADSITGCLTCLYWVNVLQE